MKSLVQVLESLQELYHFTDGKSLANILRTDTFIASGDDGYNPHGYDYFMSTTRSQYSKTGYPAAMLSDDICKVVLDGRALGARYKIKPVNFQGNTKVHAIRSAWADPAQFDDYKDERLKQTMVEAEDRILLKQDTIKNFHKYIKRIYIDNTTIRAQYADDIIRYAEKWDIPVDVTLTTAEFSIAH